MVEAPRTFQTEAWGAGDGARVRPSRSNDSALWSTPNLGATQTGIDPLTG